MNVLNEVMILMAQQNPNGGTATKGGAYSSLIMIILLIVIFWLFFIRPQSKKAKEQKKFQEELKKGDKIVTIGGIHGKIDEISEGSSTVVIETEGSKMRIEKSAINSEVSAASNK